MGLLAPQVPDIVSLYTPLVAVVSMLRIRVEPVLLPKPFAAYPITLPKVSTVGLSFTTVEE